MAAPTTVKVYPLDGVSRDFPVAFDYLSRAFVKVTLQGAANRLLTLGADYTFLTNTTIRLTQAWGPGSTPPYLRIEIRRVTSAEDRLVSFNDASILRASDLNLAELQTVHIAQEARDIASDTLGADDNGNLDARGRRLVNLADPIDAQDAVTLSYLNGQKGEIGGYRDQARQSAIESANSAAQSAASATNSRNSADEAFNSASYAGTHARSATASATEAAQSAAQSAQSAEASSQSADAARQSELNAAATAAPATELINRVNTAEQRVALLVAASENTGLLWGVVGSTSVDPYFSDAPVSTNAADRFRLRIERASLPRPGAPVGPLTFKNLDHELRMANTGEFGQDGTIPATGAVGIFVYILYNDSTDRCLVASTQRAPALTAPGLTKYKYWHRVALLDGNSAGWVSHHKLVGREVTWSLQRQLYSAGGVTAGSTYSFPFYNTYRDIVKAVTLQLNVSMSSNNYYGEGRVSICSTARGSTVIGVAPVLTSQAITFAVPQVQTTGYSSVAGVINCPGGTDNWYIWAHDSGGTVTAWSFAVTSRGYFIANGAIE